MTVSCSCGKQYRVNSSMAGRQVQCAACKQAFTIPAASAGSAPAFRTTPDMPPDPFAGGGFPDFSSMEAAQNAAPGFGFPSVPSGGGFPAGPTLPASPMMSSAGGTKKKRASRDFKKVAKWAGIGVGVLTGITIAIIGVVVALPMLSSAQSSPQAVFAAMQKAQQEKNWRVMFGYVDPEGQSSLAGILCVTAGMGASREPQLAEVAKKHGIDTSQYTVDPMQGAAGIAGLFEKAKTAGSTIQDKPGFIHDVLTAMESKIPAGALERLQEQQGTLHDVSISGDTAKGVVKRADAPEGRGASIDFVRVSGRWYVKMPTMPQFGGMPGGIF